MKRQQWRGSTPLIAAQHTTPVGRWLLVGRNWWPCLGNANGNAKLLHSTVQGSEATDQAVKRSIPRPGRAPGSNIPPSCLCMRQRDTLAAGGQWAVGRPSQKPEKRKGQQGQASASIGWPGDRPTTTRHWPLPASACLSGCCASSRPSSVLDRHPSKLGIGEGGDSDASLPENTYLVPESVAGSRETATDRVRFGNGGEHSL